MPYIKKGSKSPSFKWISVQPLHVTRKTLYFPSIITEFTDSWSPRWTTANVYGRMDPLSFYNGTSRELTLGFRVISDTHVEASKNMENIERLIQYQYPAYENLADTDGVLMPVIKAPPYFKFKFMNVVGGGKALEGYINGAVQINPGFQSKDQAQYFNPSSSKLYFSDVTIVLRIQVLHEELIGHIKSSFQGGKEYPYGTKILKTPTVAPSPSAPAKPPPQATVTAFVNGIKKLSGEIKPALTQRRKKDAEVTTALAKLNKAMADASLGPSDSSVQSTPHRRAKIHDMGKIDADPPPGVTLGKFQHGPGDD